jgi:hypothetical protein
MQNSKREKDECQTRSEMEERQSEATSKETLEDLKKSKKISESSNDPSPEDSQVPSPDGTLDEGRKQSDDAGPM